MKCVTELHGEPAVATHRESKKKKKRFREMITCKGRNNQWRCSHCDREIGRGERIPTWCRRAGKAVTRSTCRQQTAGCQHMNCSSCKTCEDESSLSGQSRYPEHPALGQTPGRKRDN